jgi:Site-specific recombinase XerD
MPIYKYTTKKGIVKYRIEFYYKNENKKNIQERKNGFATKREAQNYQIRFLARLENNDSPKILSFEQLYNFYIEDKQKRIKETTIKTVTYIVKTHIMNNFKDRNIYDITTNDIRTWHNYILDKNYSDNYNKKLHTVFSEIMNYAVKYFNLNYNVLTKVGLLPKRNNNVKEMLIYTQVEFEKFDSVIDDITFKALFNTLYWTGLRKGEAFALNWNDIDFDNKTININKTLAYVQGKERYLTSPKNATSNRKILIDNNLLQLLKELQEIQKQVAGYNDNFVVFGGVKYLGNETVRRRKKKYSELANVKEIRLHDFRHSHASWLINNGANIVLVAKRLGHKDTQMTLNTYTHLFPNAEQDILNLIEK